LFCDSLFKKQGKVEKIILSYTMALMIPQTLLVFALKAEMLNVFRNVDVKSHLSISKRKHLYQVIWQEIPFYLLQTGIGPASVLHALDALPSNINISQIVNAGTCGSLRDDVLPCDLVVPKQVVSQWDTKIQKPTNIHLDIQAVNTCITVRHSQNSHEFRSQLIHQFRADIVDMEAWVVLDWAGKHEIPAYVLKCVSDRVGPQSPVEVAMHLPTCSKQLAKALL
jgi:nucleoside phosphorylase